MSQAALQLRPMSIADLLDAAFSLYRRNFWRFTSIAAAALVPAILLQTILPPVLGASAGPVAQAIGSGVAGIVTSVASLLAYAAVVRAIAAARLGQPMSVGEAYTVGGGVLWRLFLLSILVVVVVLLLLVTIVGWIYVGVLWSLAFPVVILEHVGVFRALGRSRELVRGSWWRVFGFWIVAVMLVGIISAIVGGIGAFVVGVGLGIAGYGTGSAPFVAATAFFNVISQVIANPLLYCVTVMLYYDLRVRKEGLDLEMRSDQLAAAEA